MGLEIDSEDPSKIKKFIEEHHKLQNVGKMGIGVNFNGKSISLSYKDADGNNGHIMSATIKAAEAYIGSLSKEDKKDPSNSDLATRLDKFREEMPKWKKASERVKEKTGREIDPNILRTDVEWDLYKKFQEERQAGKHKDATENTFNEYMDKAKEPLLVPGKEKDLLRIYDKRRDLEGKLLKELFNQPKNPPQRLPIYDELVQVTPAIEVPSSIPRLGGGMKSIV